jgi:uncharacterized protein
MRYFANRRPLISFFILAYVIAWIAWLPLVLGQKGLGWIHADVPFWAIIPGTFAPTIAALCVQWLTKGNFRICHFIGSWPRFFFGLVIGLAIIAFAYIILPALMITKSPASLHWNIFLLWGAYQCNYSTFLGGPVGEEPGWRGFALPQLQARFGALRAALILGLLWACWHLPLFLIHSWAVFPVWVYIILVVGLSILMTFIFNLSRSSVIVCILMHALFNTSSILLGDLLPPNGRISMLFFLGSSWILPLVIIICTRGRLGIKKMSPNDGNSL